MNGKSFEASGHSELNVRDLKRVGTVVGGEAVDMRVCVCVCLRGRECEREKRLFLPSR